MTKRNTNIFIVEDDNFFARLVQDVLGKQNYQKIHVFNSGEACLNQIHTSPDIVILDYGLGKMNGLDVLRQIKSINPNIQVIFLSAQERMDIAVKSLKYGAYDYLEKTNEGLQRLGRLMDRITETNELVRENTYFRRMRIFLMTALGVLIATVAYMLIAHPELL